MKYYPAKLIVLLIFLLELSSCITVKQFEKTRLVTDAEYQDVIYQYTQAKQTYSGFYNTLDLHALLMKPAVLNAMNQRRAQLYLWSPEQMNSAVIKDEDSFSKETYVYLAFYSPERRVTNLERKDTVWKLFIDVGGKRYEGSVKKDKAPFLETQSMYPFFTRFHTGYIVRFDVPMGQIKSLPVQFVLTGPVDSVIFSFK